MIFEYKGFDVSFYKTEMLNWILKTITKAIEMLMPYILETLEPTLNDILKEELKKNPCKIKFLINEKF